MTDSLRLDTDKIDEVALALLALTMHRDRWVTRAWKGLDWDALNRLCEKGWIDDPKNTAKSVVFTEDGERVAKEYLRKHFALPD